MPKRSRFGFDYSSADICKWLTCLIMIVVLILSILTYNKVNKKNESYQPPFKNRNSYRRQ